MTLVLVIAATMPPIAIEQAQAQEAEQKQAETCPLPEGWEPAEDLPRILAEHRRWVEQWKGNDWSKEWARKFPQGRANLCNASLNGANLTGARLDYADLTRSKLNYADLTKSGLTRANLTEANLTGARLNYADLTRSGLTRANLTKANLTGTNLTGAELSGADLTKSGLSGADLTKANLTGAWLSGTNLTGAELNGANLTGAWLSRVNLTEVRLSGANLRGAELNGANLTGARLDYADLTRSKLNYADLTKSGLTRANLTGAELSGANLTGAELSGANLTGAGLSGANLTGAGLSGANLTGAGLSGANLTGAGLSGANLTKVALVGSNLTGTRLANANLTNATYDPASPPPDAYIVNIKGLQTVVFPKGREAGLVQVRELLQKAGLRDLERQATYAIESGRTWHAIAYGNPFEALEGQFRFIAFDLTTDYGLYPGRALRIIVYLGLALILVYFWPIRFSPQRSAPASQPSGSIYRIWSTDRVETVWDAEHQSEEILMRSAAKVERLVGGWWFAARYALYFSLLSAFSIGWKDFNVGSWIARIQAREYALRATGWVRVVSGLQSLLSVYLLAIWALTYFGRPFQ